MSDVKLGQLIEGEAERDCVHVALAPVVAAHALAPGSHVGFLDGGKVGMSQKPIGIVDPFLKTQVMAGEKFWLVLYQNTVTGMRHQWAHPSFGDFGEVYKRSGADESEHWLREFAAQWGMNFDKMVAGARDLNREGICAGDELNSGEELGADHERFWQHMERFTSRKFTDDHRDKVRWRCAC